MAIFIAALRIPPSPVRAVQLPFGPVTTIKTFAVSKLRLLSFHGMEEVAGSIPARSTNVSIAYVDG